MAKNNKPFLPNISEIIQMGINPKTGLPYKMGTLINQTKDNIKKAIRIQDEQDAITRYKWYNLPCNITGEELERMLYYYGQLAFFYVEELDEFYFMKYALDGGIDFYGRYNTIHPIPMNSGGDVQESKAQEEYLSTKVYKCIYKPIAPEKLTLDDYLHDCVILRDYSNQLPQQIIPRQVINDPIIDIESDCMPLLRTSLIAASGVRGVRVNNEDQYPSVKEGSASIEQAALNGDLYVPIAGNLEFQELVGGNSSKAQDYLMSMQAIDNFRLSTYGIGDGSLFDKKAYVNNAQTKLNQVGSSVNSPLQDGLNLRMNFCDIINSIWACGTYCEISENHTQVDTNGDGMLYDRNEEANNDGNNDTL